MSIETEREIAQSWRELANYHRRNAYRLHVAGDHSECYHR